MTDSLIIKINKEIDQDIEWIAINSSTLNIEEQSKGLISKIPQEYKKYKTTIIVPGTDVSITSVDLPIKSRKKLRTAIPYALEDQLADDLKLLHFSSGKRLSNGHLPIAVVNRSLIQNWIDQLHKNKIYPIAMYAENQCLTKKTETISLLIENSKIHINDGYSIELIFDNLDPEIAISSIINHLDNENKKEKLNYKAEKIQIFSSKKMCEQYSDAIANIKNKYKNVKVKTLDNHILQFQAKNLLSSSGINLLQGKFKVTKEYRHLLKLWRNSILLSVLLAIVVMIFFTLENNQLSNQVEQLKTIFLREYQVIAPNAKNIKDPRSIIRSLQLGNVSNKESGLFLNLLTKFSSSLKQTNNIQIQGISYRNEILDIRLLTPNIMMLDVVIQNINKSGDYEASIQSTDQVNEMVNSRMQIKRIMQ